MKKLKTSLIASFLLFAYLMHSQIVSNQTFPFLITIIYSMLFLLFSYTENLRYKYFIVTLATVIVLFVGKLSPYFSILVIFYIMLDSEHAIKLLLALLTYMLLTLTFNPNIYSIWSLIFAMLSYFVFSAYDTTTKKYHQITKERNQQFEDIYRLEEITREFSMVEAKQFELIKLEERNRIARDIHDGVGHILSRSIVQIGAMKLQASKSQSEQLTLLNESLQEAMTSIRSSVHNLHDQSLSLEVELQKLCDNSTINCQLRYQATTQMNREYIFQIIKIVSESITNSQKHSNASQIKIQFYEHAKFYQLKCSDNGTGIEIKDAGIGLLSIETRVKTMKARLNINTTNGFELLVIIPKGDTNEDTNH